MILQVQAEIFRPCWRGQSDHSDLDPTKNLYLLRLKSCIRKVSVRSILSMQGSSNMVGPNMPSLSRLCRQWSPHLRLTPRENQDELLHNKRVKISRTDFNSLDPMGVVNVEISDYILWLSSISGQAE